MTARVKRAVRTQPDLSRKLEAARRALRVLATWTHPDFDHMPPSAKSIRELTLNALEESKP